MSNADQAKLIARTWEEWTHSTRLRWAGKISPRPSVSAWKMRYGGPRMAHANSVLHRNRRADRVPASGRGAADRRRHPPGARAAGRRHAAALNCPKRPRGGRAIPRCKQSCEIPRFWRPRTYTFWDTFHKNHEVRWIRWLLWVSRARALERSARYETRRIPGGILHFSIDIKQRSVRYSRAMKLSSARARKLAGMRKTHGAGSGRRARWTVARAAP